MSSYLVLFTTLGAPVFVASVNVNIDGVIDLGPNWNYEYKIQSDEDLNHVNYIPISSKKKHRQNKKLKGTKNVGRSSREPGLLVTKFGQIEPIGIYNVPRAVKEDTKINEFTYHVYKQSLKVFDEIKKKLDPGMERKVDYLARNYDVKFRQFVNETLNKKIKTRLGSRRVVLNIIETSNRLLKRLANYFVGDMATEGILRNNMAVANVITKEVDRECELEVKHACNKFGICRTSNGFSEFMTDVLTIILKNGDDKIKQATDALTEILKNTDFSTVMDTRTKKNFRQTIESVETFDVSLLKAIFGIAKNVFALKNQPIDVMMNGSDHINKTVALLEVIDELDRNLPSNEENMLEWTDIKSSLTDWSDGKRLDILEIMQGFVTYLKKKGFDKLDGPAARNLNEKFGLIFT